MQPNYLILDIETRPDKALIRASRDPAAATDEQAYQELLAELREGGSRSDFVPLTFHVPVSIALGSVDQGRVLRSVDVLRADVSGEAEIVREFWRRLEELSGTLVTFNGRGFDLPVLELHALRTASVAPRYFTERNGLRARYGRHFDLYDFLSNGGAGRLRGGLDLLARLIGLPGKSEVSGRDVSTLWENRCFEDVHRYCRRDVIATYFLFLRVEHLCGRLTSEQLAAVESAAASFRAELSSE